MTNYRRLLITLGAAFLLGVAPVYGQTAVNSTTLSAAVADTTTTRISVAAVAATVAVNDIVVVDDEAMLVTGFDTTALRLDVSRGYAGTRASTHANSSTVWVDQPDYFGVSGPSVAGNFRPSGTCTYADRRIYPNIVIGRESVEIYDCTVSGLWVHRTDDPDHPWESVSGTFWSKRDNFDQGHNVMQDDGTAKSVTDAEVNIVWGSPLGTISYREELGKTTSSWVAINQILDLSADDTVDNEGVEILLGNGTDPTLHQTIEAGTNGACVSALIDIADISGTDQVQIGWRQNEAYQDAASYVGYTVWSTVGPNATDGSIVSSQEVSEATDTDDSNVNWADGEERALKVCMSSGGVPTAWYSDASPGDFPNYNAITMTNTGGTATAGTGMVPFLSYLAAGTDGADVTVLWLQTEHAP